MIIRNYKKFLFRYDNSVMYYIMLLFFRILMFYGYILKNSQIKCYDTWDLLQSMSWEVTDVTGSA